MAHQRWPICTVLVILLLVNCLVSVTAKPCDRDPSRTGVTKGSHAASGSCRFRYLVSIKHPVIGHICAGTLIGPKHVLTAASCLAGLPDLTADINGYYRNGPFSAEADIISVTLHPQFSGDNDPYDVAIVELSKPISTSKAKIITFARNTPPDGVSVAIVGWGRTGPQAPFSDVVQVRRDYKISPSACNTISVTNGFLCAGKNNVNICEGDVGGPLISMGSNESGDIQVGVISKAVGDCTRNGQPGLFVNIADISGWIDSVV